MDDRHASPLCARDPDRFASQFSSDEILSARARVLANTRKRGGHSRSRYYRVCTYTCSAVKVSARSAAPLTLCECLMQERSSILVKRAISRASM